MHIVIIETGGVGGYFGAKLAKAGHQLTFVARGAHLQAMQNNGLSIKSIQGDFKLDTPMNTFICDALLPLEHTARKLTSL